jgi:hypothetical protein
MRSIRAITCRADLDDSAAEIDQAREQAAAGDPSWQQWIDEYDHGRALVVRLEVTISFDEGDKIDEIAVVNRGVWIEASRHPPAVAGQLEEVVSKDFNNLSARLRQQGLQVTASDLSEMYTRVELSADMLRALDEKPLGDRGLLPEVQESGG